MLTPDQARIVPFKVVPALPENLRPLMAIAQNLWWTWHPDAVELFVRVDRQLWTQTNHNPVKLLGMADQSRLDELSKDDAFIAAVDRVHDRLKIHLSQNAWYQRQYGDADADGCCIAYFCAEFGLHESLPIYSGGLGVLAGDHVKSASALGLPFVGVGLMYRNGYFQQYLNADGWQQEFYPDLDFSTLPVAPVPGEDGKQLIVRVQLPGRDVSIAVWLASIGRVRLFLLDTNLPDNDPADRVITKQLYGGDMDMRIRQEIVLGIGGTRALEAMDIHPTVYHMNEGHAAFLALERIRMLIDRHGVAFDQARTAGAAGNVFTTHTPVPAGIDRFPVEMIHHYFRDYVGGIGLDMEGLLALGRENVFNKNESFSMAVMALRCSDSANGVSKLHGKVSRDMWRSIFPKLPAEEVPIGHVTNGVHARSWLSADMNRLLDRYLSMQWQTTPEDHSVWAGVDEIPDEELWRVRHDRRARLVTWVRWRLRQQLKRRNASSADLRAAGTALDPDALTIGFARRFATYKRANLLLRDRDRLKRIITNADRPVQLVIAGKAHPADTQGKELIRELVHFGRDLSGPRRVVFIENYDMNVARYMVQGVDVWLNNPRRGMEASGTSGMKAALNGVLNLSILDGWWDEAYEESPTSELGWAIGRGEVYANYDYQDQVESQALYDLLEGQVVPAFYDRTDGIPRQWVQWMKNCLMHLAPMFNTTRMVQDYAEKFYLPAHERSHKMLAGNLDNAIALTSEVAQLRANWNRIKVESIEADTSTPLGVCHPLNVTAVVHLGDIDPSTVRVQTYYGRLDGDGRVQDATTVDMNHVESVGNGKYRYRGELKVENSGQHGFAVRVIPGLDSLGTPYLPGLITWDAGGSPAGAPEVIEEEAVTA